MAKIQLRFASDRVGPDPTVTIEPFYAAFVDDEGNVEQHGRKFSVCVSGCLSNEGDGGTASAGEEGQALPLHRTEAGWPNCSTCDGGGCPDCTDPA